MNYLDFKEKWKAFGNTSLGFLKLAIDHPLGFHVGFTNDKHKALIIMDTGKIDEIPCSNAIKATNILTTNGKWILELQLLSDKFEEEFLCLGWDIIINSKNANDPVKALIQRYLKWQRLLQYSNAEVMPFSRQKGLIGELLYLLDNIESIGLENTLHAWVGPDGADQDFIFSNSWTEIKAVSLASDKVKISSFEQLLQEMDGNLCVYTLETTTTGDDHILLSRLVNKIRTMLNSNIDLLDEFEMKIFKYGYRNKDEVEYNKHEFRLIERRDYIVNDAFPKLTKNNIPIEIISGEYSLSLAAIEKYRRL